MDRYRNFGELQVYEVENRDYKINHKRGKHPVLIMSPHGGNIEPFTSQIAEWIAGTDFSLYIFEGIKETGIRDLHITSHHFDEPVALELVTEADIVLTIHGLLNSVDEFIMVGGLDTDLGDELKIALSKADFTIRESETQYSGLHPNNICNRGRSGKGIQLEITYTLRKRLFEDLDCRQRFVNVTRSVLLQGLRLY